MGTSQSKRDSRPGTPLVPSWAEKDPPKPPNPDNANPQGTPATQPPATQQHGVAPSRRYAGFRIALGSFAHSGSRDEGRQALGRWASNASGGARVYQRRIARAARTGGAALAAFARAGAGQAAPRGTLDVRSLAGQPIETVINTIVDTFCPPGILDEELARIAIGEALTEALAGADTFDPAAIDANAVRVATLAFVAELVFLGVAGDAGNALAAAPTPAAAVARESEIRSLIREVTDIVGTPILNASSGTLSQQAISSLVSQLVQAVVGEISTWE